MSTEEIVQVVQNSGLKRITILGGEPLDQPHSIQALIYRLKLWVPGCTIMLFTGFEKDDAKSRLGLVWKAIDVIITGPYEASKPDNRKWIGSTNQQIHFKDAKHMNWKWPLKEGFEFEFSYDEKGAYQNGL